MSTTETACGRSVTAEEGTDQERVLALYDTHARDVYRPTGEKPSSLQDIDCRCGHSFVQKVLSQCRERANASAVHSADSVR